MRTFGGGYNVYSYGNYQANILKKKRKKLQSTFIIISVVFLFVVLIIVFLRSSYFAVTTIKVEGIETIPVAEVRRAAGIEEGENMWQVNPEKIRNRVGRLIKVKSVEVKRILPGTVSIRIIERKPVALTPYQDWFLELSGDGRVIGVREEFGRGLPLITGLYGHMMPVSEMLPDHEQGIAVQEFLALLERYPDLPISELNVSDPNHLLLYTLNGTEVWLGNTELLEEKIELLNYILPELTEIEVTEGYLDLRALDKPVFTPAD